eukprot:1835303-Rhodomonas_salina.3
MPGTDIPIRLRPYYAMCSTDTQYAAIRSPPCLVPGQLRYALLGTDSTGLSAYALAMRCPVLT